jgi:hypothetical protein
VCLGIVFIVLIYAVSVGFDKLGGKLEMMLSKSDMFIEKFNSMISFCHEAIKICRKAGWFKSVANYLFQVGAD